MSGRRGAAERYVLSRAEQTSNGIDYGHLIATFDGADDWKQNFVYRDEIDGVVMLEQKDLLDFDTDGITQDLYLGLAREARRVRGAAPR